MSIEQSDVIDTIGVERLSGKLILTIADHLSWDDEKNHILLLQEKLNTYLRFVESGEVLVSYPDAAGRNVVIDLVCKHAMTEAGRLFVKEAEPILRGAGVELRWRLFPEDPDPG